jgi:hypothetical protein
VNFVPLTTSVKVLFSTSSCIFIASYYNKFGQESRAASPAFFPSRA